MANSGKIYPRSGDKETVYLKSVISDPNISVGEFTMYNDYVNDPMQFERNNVLYQYPINHDKLIIGKFCSIACGAKFIFNSANHTLSSVSTYPFPIFFEEWGLNIKDVAAAWDNKGDIIIGNDVWIGYEAVIMAGVTVGDGAIIGTRAVVTKDVPPYTIVGGVPAKPIRKRFDNETLDELLKIRWWDWSEEKIARNIQAIQSGCLKQLKKKKKTRGKKTMLKNRRYGMILTMKVVSLLFLIIVCIGGIMVVSNKEKYESKNYSFSDSMDKSEFENMLDTNEIPYRIRSADTISVTKDYIGEADKVYNIIFE